MRERELGQYLQRNVVACSIAVLSILLLISTGTPDIHPCTRTCPHGFSSPHFAARISPKRIRVHVVALDASRLNGAHISIDVNNIGSLVADDSRPVSHVMIALRC